MEENLGQLMSDFGKLEDQALEVFGLLLELWIFENVLLLDLVHLANEENFDEQFLHLRLVQHSNFKEEVDDFDDGQMALELHLHVVH